MGLLESQRQSISLRGKQDQMHVVGHQAVPEKRDLVKLQLLLQQLQINGFLGFRCKQKLPGIPALGNVVRHVSYCNTCQTRHTR